MPLIFGLFFGFMALISQPQQLPVDFIHGALTRSEAVSTFEPGYLDGFIGIEWICDESEARANGKTDLTPTEFAEEVGSTRNDLPEDVCYAGLTSTDDLDRSHPGWMLVTGP